MVKLPADGFGNTCKDGVIVVSFMLVVPLIVGVVILNLYDIQEAPKTGLTTLR